MEISTPWIARTKDSVRLGRLYLGSYPIIDSPGFWPVKIVPFHHDEPCCSETRSLAVEFVSPRGNGRGFEAEWTISPPDFSRKWTDYSFDHAAEDFPPGISSAADNADTQSEVHK